MLSALFLCAPPEDRDNRSLSENFGQRTCQPKINLPEWKDISQKGDNTCGEIGQENSEHDAKRYSNAGLPWVTRQPTRQRQGKNGEQHHQCKFCERCTELQGTPFPIGRSLTAAVFPEKINDRLDRATRHRAIKAIAGMTLSRCCGSFQPILRRRSGFRAMIPPVYRVGGQGSPIKIQAPASPREPEFKGERRPDRLSRRGSPCHLPTGPCHRRKRRLPPCRPCG